MADVLVTQVIIEVLTVSGLAASIAATATPIIVGGTGGFSGAVPFAGTITWLNG